MNWFTLTSASPGLLHWLTLSTLLFAIGLYGLFTRRNAVGVLISIEILVNSAALNFVIFNRFIAPQSIDGQVMTIFIIATAAAEVVAAMAIMVVLYRNRRTMDVSRFDSLKQEQNASSEEPLALALVSPAVRPVPAASHTHSVTPH